ncbi:MAG: ECF transporter S component, partial [Fervidicoccus fontis]
MKVNIVRFAVFTALVYVFTVVVQFAQPFTGGYFNLGEAAIYVCALISDPLTTGLAGGIGSALADATTGYGIFAPATLLIKFTEGYVASLLFKKMGRSNSSIANWLVSLI